MPPGILAFAAYDASHKTVLALMVGLSAVLVAISRARGSEVTNRVIAAGLAAVLVLVKVVEVYVTLCMDTGKDWRDALPLHMCDVSAIAAIVALLGRKQIAFEMAYFWALGGTLQAMLTPDLKFDFPDVRFLAFFIAHGVTLVAVAFLALGLRMRPYPISLLRIFILGNVYVVIVGVADWFTGRNYGYLHAKPLHASLLDYLGPWPWYILSLEAMAVVSYLVYYAPFFIMDRMRKHKAPAVV